MVIAEKERLKILRVKADLTQEELAEKAGVTSRTINAYEVDVNNMRKARYETIEKIATALNTQVDNIFLG